MQREVFFSTVALVGVTLAGFTGVVTVFRSPASRWQPNEIAGLKWMLEHSFAAVFFALLPFALNEWICREPELWRVLCLLLAAFFVGELGIQVVRFRRTPPRSPKVLGLFMGITLLVLIFLVASAFGGSALRAGSIALIWLLVVAGAQFMFFVIRASTATR